ncbi:tRNA-dihydrouridine synthase [Aureimonas endophytica]|uniref:tRNA-dihydrouridine synthase n=1 Tax=Aureimonas endophytica TaxID=2027858 RepID=A0A916ZCV9_9HYPH|nr:tRNA dihydrouridine synthase DusB [Aureimonas endophytica]GGD89170.1 tRNA-dihydrouridine synthase [Aureimonas endophytica]
MPRVSRPADRSLAEPLAVASLRLPNRVFLAPLSGISDVPFRRLARRFGAGSVVSEMVASAELVKNHPESLLRAMRDGMGAHIVQLAGRDPVWMRAAAERLADLGADAIDINMGCPAKKVVGGLSGSALMREPELALAIVEATVAGAGSVPVTLKMRLGWDEQSINAPAIAARAEAAGIRMIAVHGRTRMQFYSGRADWPAIAAVKTAVSVPLVANGDLTRPDEAQAMLRLSGADALMIGRGAQGRPWLPGLVAGAVGRADLEAVSLSDLICEHYEAMLEHYGQEVGAKAARKHLGWYLDRLEPGASPARTELLSTDDPALVPRLVRRRFAGLSAADAEFSAAVSRREAA